MNRREFTQWMGAGIAGAWTLGNRGRGALAAPTSAQAPVALTGSGMFLVRGKPVFLVSGSMDYFRCPPELWRDRLLKAKRGGLNCIASCIMWNFHEPEDGRFDFAGERDLGRFIDICGELGLYFYARVGPFVCDEWDGGGHPWWLIARDDIQFRALHEPTLKYVRRWFEHLLPVLAERQVTRGGPVIMVQQENEYYYADRPDGRDYQATLVRWMRELGIDATITDCNGFDTRVPGSLQTLNGFNMGAVERYRQDRPQLPVMVSEFYPGYLECWGQQPATTSVELLRPQLMEMLSARVMYNYFMYHGGTNFGFRASSSWQTDYAFVTTCYYPYGPLAEGGAFNDSFRASKSVDQLGTNFQEFICLAAPVATPLEAAGAIRVSALSAPQGTMLFVLPGKNAGEKPGALILTSGERIELADAAASPLMVPYALTARTGCRIDWANSTLLGIAGSDRKPVVVFYGNEAFKGQVSINGSVVEFGFGTQEPDIKQVGGVLVMGLSHTLMTRAWFVDQRLIVGPAYVGERRDSQHECWFHGGQTPVHVVESDGGRQRHVISALPTPDDKVELAGWRSHVPPEINGGGKDWQPLNGHASLEQMGVELGYAWYRASHHAEQAHATTLQFTQAADRFHVFLNGKACGVWGRGANATRDPLPMELTAGDNDLVLLCDNMGHSSEGRAKERKGILGPVVLGARTLLLERPERFTPEGPPAEGYEFKTYRAHHGGRLSGLAWTVMPQAGEKLLLNLREVPQYAWVRVNGQIVGEHGGNFSLVNGFSFKELILTVDAAKPTRIELILWGAPLPDPGPHVRLFGIPEKTGLTQWRFKRWETPAGEGAAVPGAPVWWECTLPKPTLPGPLFLHPVGFSKGQVYLNGRAAGRYWEIGPQRTLYLPEPWWKEQNQLAIFDEEGRSPEQVFLKRDARVATTQSVI